MTEVKKIATRKSYGNALAELGSQHNDLVVLDAGLSTMGLVPFAFSFALYNTGKRKP